MKKKYEKPQIKMVALRTEERLATCDVIYYSTHQESACGDNQFHITNPSACKLVISEVSGS